MVFDGDQNGTSLTTDGVIVSVDAVSRSFIDASDSEHTAEDAKLWMIFLRVSSGLSLVGSIYVLSSLIGTRERRSGSMDLLFNRLLLGICIFDILSSTAMLLGSWPMQASPPGDYEGNVSQAWWDANFPGAAGDKTTCTLQGFFLHVGMAGSTFFTSFVAVQTLLVVRYAWRNQRMRKAEIAFYTVGIAVPLAGGIWAAVSNSITNFPVGFCWIGVTPLECEDEMGGPLFDEYCDDILLLENGRIYRDVLSMAALFFAILAIAYSMISLFCYVRKQEKQAARWSLTSQRGQQQKKVLVRATMYIAGFVGIWIPSIIALMKASVAGISVAAALLPLQGFLNALIYSGVVDRCFLRNKPHRGRPPPAIELATPSIEMPSRSIDMASRSIELESRSQSEEVA
eukprot:scaffold22607_cov123-Cylindrotheca_fusiformis.AAC.15